MAKLRFGHETIDTNHYSQRNRPPDGGGEAVADLRKFSLEDSIRLAAVAHGDRLRVAQYRDFEEERDEHICLCRLVGRKCDEYNCLNIPGRDHVRMYNKNGKPHMIVFHPYHLSADTMSKLFRLGEEWGIEVLVDGASDYFPGRSVRVMLRPIEKKEYPLPYDDEHTAWCDAPTLSALDYAWELMSTMYVMNGDVAVIYYEDPESIGETIRFYASLLEVAYAVFASQAHGHWCDLTEHYDPPTKPEFDEAILSLMRCNLNVRKLAGQLHWHDVLEWSEDDAFEDLKIPRAVPQP